MLKRLTIQNYALIESLDIEFPNGLIIITGETGAGKSILLGALSLLLGGKADVGVLKDSSKNCVVEGIFDITTIRDSFKDILDEAEVELDSNELLLRRVVSVAGRSRAFINDSPVSLSLLMQISNRLVDIHAQHQHLLLTNEEYQLKVLDYFAGANELLAKYKELYKSLVGAKNELVKLDEAIEQFNKDLDYKQFQFDKLNEANLVEGELGELEVEQKQLANAEEIKSLTCNAASLLSNNSYSLVQNLKDISNLLRKCSNFATSYESLASRVESCRIECKDIEAEIEELGDSVVVSPQRLEVVDERIALIYSLLKKYSVSSEQELIKIKEELEEDLLNSTFNDKKREKIANEVDSLDAKLKELGKELYHKRLANKDKLAEVLQSKIRDLEMPHAMFRIDVIHTELYGSNGADRIDFNFSANGGNKLVQISKVASGGELSRIMLCLKALMAEYTGMPTMIFDEIDTGVSGSIADKMGNLIGRMGSSMQIFAITHLPQIAAKGNAHFLVYKEFGGESGAKSLLRRLDSRERVMEIARMLSGAELSDAAIDNAKFLLKK